MSMSATASRRCLNAEETFQVTLLATCEITKNIIRDRNPGVKKRTYYLDRLDRDIEGLNQTFDGYLPDAFREAAEVYHTEIENAVNKLLSTFREEIDGTAVAGPQAT